ncbi:MAG: TIGR01906 family membrane protein [Clostridia bacterium]|nr:TIGR01906 family membrane protein [Clostridia bacterium]
MKRKILSVCTGFLTALCIISGSIALPILIRPFYYAHITPLKLELISGKTYSQIVSAYNEMLDYCMGLTNEFSLGEFAFSAEGAAHFKDVRVLFILDLLVFFITALILIAIFVTLKIKGKGLYKFKGRSPLFFASLFVLGLFAAIGILASVDFTAAFEVFHKIFFAGKTNWTFNIYTDPIILVLPEQFFSNCAIFILLNLIVSCATLIIMDLIKKNPKK